MLFLHNCKYLNMNPKITPIINCKLMKSIKKRERKWQNYQKFSKLY